MDAAVPFSAPVLLACVYYRVGADDVAHAIAAVREFQRGLPARLGDLQPQVLVRCAVPALEPTAPAASASPDATLMETYRLALPVPASSDAARAVVGDVLAALSAAAASLAPWQRGDRHVELFAPCA